MPTVPFITTIGGYFLLNESLTIIQIFGLLFMAVGMSVPGIVSLINRKHNTSA